MIFCSSLRKRFEFRALQSVHWKANLRSGLPFKVIFISKWGRKGNRRKLKVRPIHKIHSEKTFQEKPGQHWSTTTGLWFSHQAQSVARQHKVTVTLGKGHSTSNPLNDARSLTTALLCQLLSVSLEHGRSINYQSKTVPRVFFNYYLFCIFSKLACSECSNRWSHNIWNNIKLAAQSSQGLSRNRFMLISAYVCIKNYTE